MLTTYHVKERLCYITLNRPEKKNALNAELIKELHQHFLMAKADDLAKVVILKAEGDVFSAGADLKYLKQLQTNSYEENLQDSQLLRALFEEIHAFPKIVIAQVEGNAIAGGCGLATICDFTFSTPSAAFGYTEVKIGFIPALVSVFLQYKISLAHLKNLLFTGDLISADEALKIGLINKVFDKEIIAVETEKFALKICKSASGQSLSSTKKLINNTAGLNLETALNLAVIENATARSSADCRRGIAAFLNKEKLSW